MDLYDFRSQLKAIELMPREYSVLADFFCKEDEVVENDKAIYDFRKGTKPMAPVVHPGVGGVIMEREGYETREIGFCTIAPERLIEDQNLKGRMFGEAVLGAMTPEQRERKIMARDLMEMRKAIQRRREWMVRQVLLTGKLQIFEYTNEGKSANATAVADYSFTNNFTPTTAWGQSGADICGDMEQIYDLVYDGLGDVEKIVMAPDVWAAMRNDDAFMKTMDMRNVDMGEIQQRYRGQGLRFLGHNADGVELWSVSGTFVDDDGVKKALMPAGTLIAGGSDILRMPYGPVTQVEETGMNARHKTYIKKEVPLRHGSVDGNAIMNRLTSRPTVIPFNVDAWAVAHVK